MNDLLSPLQAPPPRYLLESDSSDEEGQGAYPGSSTGSTSKTRATDVKVELTSQIEYAGGVIVGIGQVGRYLLRKSVKGGNVVQLNVGGKSTGQGYKVGNGLLLVIDEGDLPPDILWQVVDKLIISIHAKSWLVVSSYVPAMYIPSKAETKSGKLRGDPPIRYLSSATTAATGKHDTMDKYDSPNYLTGLAAGIMSAATHPSSSLSQSSTVLLPLPLSTLASANLTKALETFSPDLGTNLTKRASWSEADDEPYSAPGMGKVRGSRKGVGEAAAMYT